MKQVPNVTRLKKGKPQLPFDLQFYWSPERNLSVGNKIFYYIPICFAAKYVCGRKSNMGEIRPGT